MRQSLHRRLWPVPTYIAHRFIVEHLQYLVDLLLLLVLILDDCLQITANFIIIVINLRQAALLHQAQQLDHSAD